MSRPQPLAITFLAGTPFAFYPGRFQMLAIELAARGHDVHYFSQPTTLKVRYQLHRMRGAFHRTQSGNVDDPRSYRPDVVVHEHAPMLPLPFGRFGAVERANDLLLAAQVRIALRSVARPHVAVVFMPEWLTRLGRAQFDAVIYDVPDELKLMTTFVPERAQAAHLACIATADAVTVTANPTLRAGLQPLMAGKPLYDLGNGVDFDYFMANATIDTREVLPELAQPTIGFVGAIHYWVDVALIAAVARLMPHCRFVLVGNMDAISGAALQAAQPPDNLILLGRQPKSLVPALIKRFDVALIPFHAGPIADTTDPIKMYEYFAMGRSVVATPMPSLQPFAEQGLIDFATDAAQFAAAIERKLAGDGDAERRVSLARNASWQQRAVELEGICAQLLAAKH